MLGFAMHLSNRKAVIIGVLSLSLPLRVWADDRSTKVSFTAADGYWIYADYYPRAQEYRNGAEDAPIVVLIHDFGADRNSWLPLIEPLRHIGAAVLALDLRGHGESATEDTRERAQRADPGLYREMQSDLRGAYDWLASQGNVDRARFSIIAAGSGAAVALQYAAKDRSVDVVVCLTPPWDQLTFDPVADMRQVRGRNILLVAGPAEEEICKSLAGHTKGAEVRTSQAPGRGCELLAADSQLCSAIAKFAQDRMGSRSKAVVCGSIESYIYHTLDSAWVAKINPTNLRYYSSPDEAEARGLRRARSMAPDERSSRHRPPRKP